MKAKMARVSMWAVAGLLMLGLGSAERAEAAESRIGVVNVTRVFNSYKKVKDIQERLKARFDARRRELQAKEKQMREFRDIIELDVRSGRDPKVDREVFKKMQQLQEMEFSLSDEFRKLRKDVEKFRMDEMKEVLKDIRAAIRTVGSELGFDLVMRAPEYDDKLEPIDAGEAAPAGEGENAEQRDEAQSAMELVARFRENPVLFHGKDVDITEKVIARLNADHEKSGAGAPAPAPAPGQ